MVDELMYNIVDVRIKERDSGKYCVVLSTGIVISAAIVKHKNI